MENSTEPSSSLSFTSPYKVSETVGQQNHDMLSLSKLSSNLEQLLYVSVSSSSDFSDADIVVEDVAIPVHRCILASRSKFFDDVFRKDKNGGVLGVKRDGKSRYCMIDLLPYGKVGYEAFCIFLNYLYTGKLKVSPVEVSTCVDHLCAHDTCRPAIDFVVELMYASTIFQISELVSVFQRRLINLVGKATVEDVVPILFVAYHCKLNELLNQCVERVARSDLEMINIEKELPHEIAENIRLLRLNIRLEPSQLTVVDPVHEKRIKRILKALDSDDVELVRLLLTESDITLDEAYALHYSVAYCDAKIVSEVLSLGLSDVNLRNTRGNTVLHVAARRREPTIIVSLLTKGASPFETTMEGQSAVSICKRLTRPKDYQMKTEKGQEANKYRICIDVLEREIRRNPVVADSSFSSIAMVDDLQMKLLYLEDRVAFAQMFFPTEAKLAMEIAHAESTLELASLLSSRGSTGNLMEVDLNESPISQNRRLLSRIETLSRTVELGRRYFPNCSQVLDKFMEDDLPDALYLERGTPEEQNMKRMRFIELKEEVHRAFNKDKAELHRSGVSSSSSSSSFKDRLRHKVRKV